MLSRRMIGVGAAAMAGAIALAGCSGGSGGDASGDGTGDAVEILGAFTDVRAAAFQADLDTWSETSGVAVEYVGNPDFQTGVITRASGGNPPDIAIYPQPGVLLSQTQQLYSFADLDLDVDEITSDMTEGLGDIGVQDGETYGMPSFVNVKSAVWYNPVAFETAGLTVPTTDAELTALSQQIIDQGLGYPWCVGLEAGSATGWPVTDWLEQYVLNYGGLEDYAQWITGDIKFNSDVVNEAGDKVTDLLLQPGQVNGGGPAAATTSYTTAGNQLFVTGKENGQCFMMRQGTFITDFFPDDIKAEIAAGDYSNVDFFQLPAPEGTPQAMLGGGDLVGAFSNDENTKAVMAYLTSADFGTNGFGSQGTFLSPHNDFPADLYSTEIQKKAAAALAAADIFGFDGSDLMPAEVGSGTEWTNLTAWFSGQKTMEQAFDDIDATFPTE